MRRILLRLMRPTSSDCLSNESERELHRLRTALRGSVVDGFDVVAVGVEGEGGVVAGVVRAAVAGLEGDVVAAGEFALRGFVVGGGDEYSSPRMKKNCTEAKLLLQSQKCEYVS
jgi:hypothetical protein